jgi:hypothetical protein
LCLLKAHGLVHFLTEKLIEVSPKANGGIKIGVGAGLIGTDLYKVLVLLIQRPEPA